MIMLTKMQRAQKACDQMGNKIPRSKFRSEVQNVLTENVNQIALSANDDKRIQTPDKVISYPYNTGLRRVCIEALLKHPKIKN